MVVAVQRKLCRVNVYYQALVLWYSTNSHELCNSQVYGPNKGKVHASGSILPTGQGQILQRSS